MLSKTPPLYRPKQPKIEFPQHLFSTAAMKITQVITEHKKTEADTCVIHFDLFLTSSQ